MVQGGGKRGKGDWRKVCAMPCAIPGHGNENGNENRIEWNEGDSGEEIHRVRIVAWKTVERRTFLSLFSV